MTAKLRVLIATSVALVAMSVAATAASAAPWTPVPITLPAGAAEGSLRGVSCPAAGSCVAVGSHSATQSSLRGKPMVVTETAGAWEPAVALAPPGDEEQSVLESVSCAAVGTCVAVGVEGKIGLQPTHPIAVAETGGQWGQAVDVTPPGGATHALLYGVSCPSTTSCVAVGGDDSGPFTVTETDGTWGTAEQITMPAGLTGPNFEVPTVSLLGVSCTAVGSCVAVGEGWDTSGQNQAAIAATETAGHWGQAVVIAPPTAPSSPNARVLLEGVSCAAGGSCLAVGDNEGHGPFAAGDTGGAWGQSASVPPPAGATNSALLGVSCPAGSCLAVGEAGIGGENLPMVSAESGGTWTQVAVEPPTGATFGELTGISCPTAEACVAVGLAESAADGGTPLVYGGGAPATEPGGGGSSSSSITVTTINSPRGGGTTPYCSLSLKGGAISVSPAGVAKVELTDDGSGPCDGTASLSIPVKAKAKGKGRGAGRRSATSREVGSGTVRLSPGQSATVAVKLNGVGRAALAQSGGGLKASLAVEAGGARLVEAISLRAAPRKHTGARRHGGAGRG
jgi:hypothetical protein